MAKHLLRSKPLRWNKGRFGYAMSSAGKEAAHVALYSHYPTFTIYRSQMQGLDYKIIELDKSWRPFRYLFLTFE